jgi:hypothetical protein
MKTEGCVHASDPDSDQYLMSHQDGFGNNGTESTGLTKPDDGDDCMQNERENDAHGQDGVKTQEAIEFRALTELAHHKSVRPV